VADELIPDEEFPWPAEGDDPFKMGSSSRALIACLNFTHDEPWGAMAEGFKRMADVGLRHLEQTGRGQDYLVYPIVYCYRHYVELSLKEIIRAARMLLDEQGGVPSTHNLDALWNTAEPLLKQIADSPETYRSVRNCLARFNELDPQSDAFRYPVRANGDPSLPGVQNLDLGQVRDVVERLSGFLLGACEQTLVSLDFKNEMTQWYGP
jgi:hypothetical protein